MQASQSTTIEASPGITRHPSLPASMRREDVDALKAQQARMTGDCKGHSAATRAAMAWLITANATTHAGKPACKVGRSAAMGRGESRAQSEPRSPAHVAR